MELGIVWDGKNIIYLNGGKEISHVEAIRRLQRGEYERIEIDLNEKIRTPCEAFSEMQGLKRRLERLIK